MSKSSGLLILGFILFTSIYFGYSTAQSRTARIKTSRKIATARSPFRKKPYSGPRRKPEFSTLRSNERGAYPKRIEADGGTGVRPVMVPEGHSRISQSYKERYSMNHKSVPDRITVKHPIAVGKRVYIRRQYPIRVLQTGPRKKITLQQTNQENMSSKAKTTTSTQATTTQTTLASTTYKNRSSKMTTTATTTSTEEPTPDAITSRTIQTTTTTETPTTTITTTTKAPSTTITELITTITTRKTPSTTSSTTPGTTSFTTLDTKTVPPPTTKPYKTPSPTSPRTRTSRRRLIFRPYYAQRRMRTYASSGGEQKRVYEELSLMHRKFSDMLEKQKQFGRQENRKMWKRIADVQMDYKNLDSKSKILHRNITDIYGKIGGNSKQLESYRQSNLHKIEQIETHQGNQDDQYYSMYERTENNTRRIDRLSRKMANLVPLVGTLAETVEIANSREEKAMELLDSFTRGSFSNMSNQILVQQRTISNLGDRVRTEFDLLHEVKQSMSKSMEQNHRNLAETVNSHLSAHSRLINRVESSVSRQGERIKYLIQIAERHQSMLDSKDELDISLMKHIDNITNYLTIMASNISSVSQMCYATQSNLKASNSKLATAEEDVHHLNVHSQNQSLMMSQIRQSEDKTSQEIERLSEGLNALTQKHDEEFASIRGELDKVSAVQKIHQKNISAIAEQNRDIAMGRRVISEYLSDEPQQDTPPRVRQNFRRLLTELGVDERITRLSRVLRRQQIRMANVTRLVRVIADDKEEIKDTATHYLSVIQSQADLIKDQNKTITKLASMLGEQGATIESLGDELVSEQENVMKLTSILANMAANAKNPMSSQRDCHDVWLNGHRESGVYNIIENMKLRPVYCNLTKYGGWTIIQQRIDGSQDFDRTFEEYRQGFGDVYGEYWLGLEGIEVITRKVRTRVTLQIILEDWNGDTRMATYSRFSLYGKGYSISIDGYEGDAGDSLGNANGLLFSAKLTNHDYGNACNSRRRGGWWFSSPQNDCGASNLNGEYRRFPDIKTESSSSIFWKNWHGSSYPLKRVTMQVIPTEVYEKIKAAPVEETELFDSYGGIDSDGSDYFDTRATYDRDGDLSSELPLDYDNYNFDDLLRDG